MYYFLSSVAEYAKNIGDERRPFALDTWEKAYALWNEQQDDLDTAIPGNRL